MKLQVEKFVTGPIETNSYVLSNDAGAAIVFDPSTGCDAIIDYLKENGLTLEAVCLTHGHFDHFMGTPELVAAFPQAEVWIHKDEAFMLRDPEYNGSYMLGGEFKYEGPLKEYEEGSVTMGSFTFEVLLIGGHSPGGSALIIDIHCFSGDALFAGSVGRTDFPGCDASLLFTNIKEKLFNLPEETIVYPGHMGRTTIGREKRMNPFF